ncbi:MAG TPA: glycosyltransferase [Anaerolinea sp.]|nr:glycosyltransferase [Anaerolinea sp.]
MRILIGLTYYRPHYSGLTIYTERLARTLAARGHEVTVLTSRFDPQTPEVETRDGVKIVRAKVALRLSKGVIMPSMAAKALGLIRSADVVNLHVPQLDAAYLALISRWMGKPVVLTYHCDLRLPKGLINVLANLGSDLANRISAGAANVIVTNTRDFAENSSFLRGYLNKVEPVLPPVELPAVAAEDLAAFRQKYNIQPGEKIIGINARLATEKGVEYLVEAMPAVLERYPTARVLYVGQHKNVFGEEEYARRLEPLIQTLDGHWTFLGVVTPQEQVAFFNVCDVTVLPSINSTESYGMVQVESMFCGTPVVASDLPGVRHAVRTTGMGKIVPPRDAASLAKAILEVLDRPEEFQGDVPAIKRRYQSDTTASAYEAIFEELAPAK